MVETGRYRSQIVTFDRPVWEGDTLTPEIWALLNQRDQLIEISAGEGPHRLLLGAPHHAAPGVEGIADDWSNPRSGELGRPADETAGLLALAVFRALCQRGIACKVLIAAHATDHDPNKTPGCPYWQHVFATPHPALILELHGAGRLRTHDLELSAGRNGLANPLQVGRKVAAGLVHARSGRWGLAAQDRPGFSSGLLLAGGQEKTCRLQNPALQTDLLHAAGQAGVAALHLEAKRIFRRLDPASPQTPRPTPAAWDLAHALAGALADGSEQY